MKGIGALSLRARHFEVYCENTAMRRKSGEHVDEKEVRRALAYHFNEMNETIGPAETHELRFLQDRFNLTAALINLEDGVRKCLPTASDGTPEHQNLNLQASIRLLANQIKRTWKSIHHQNTNQGCGQQA